MSETIDLRKVPHPDGWPINAVVDERGILSYLEDFDISCFKRLYFLSNHAPGLVRAWQGSKREGRLIIPIRGSGVVVIGPMRVFETPEIVEGPIFNETFDRWAMTEKQRSALWIPPEYVYGIKLYGSHSEFMILSTCTVEESHESIEAWGPEVFSAVWNIS